MLRTATNTVGFTGKWQLLGDWKQVGNRQVSEKSKGDPEKPGEWKEQSPSHQHICPCSKQIPCWHSILVTGRRASHQFKTRKPSQCLEGFTRVQVSETVHEEKEGGWDYRTSKALAKVINLYLPRSVLSDQISLLQMKTTKIQKYIQKAPMMKCLVNVRQQKKKHFGKTRKSRGRGTIMDREAHAQHATPTDWIRASTERTWQVARKCWFEGTHWGK